MMYYLLPVFSYFLFALQEKRIKPVSFIWFIASTFLLFVLLIGMFRGIGIGTDYYSYYYIFKAESDIEIGFVELIRFVKYLGGNFQIFISFIFLSSFLIKIYFFQKISPIPYISLMIYLGFWFLVYDMNGIRQGLAMSITLAASWYLLRNEKKTYFLLVLLAILFHYSAIVFLPFVFILKKEFSNKTAIILVGVFLLIAQFNISESITMYIINFLGFDNVVAEKISTYSRDTLYNANVLHSFSTIHRLFIMGCIMYLLPKVSMNPALRNLLLWASVISILLYLLFCNIEIIATRLSLYYRFFECISLACFPLAFAKNNSRLFVGGILLLYVIFQVMSTLNVDGGSNLEPYYFCF